MTSTTNNNASSITTTTTNNNNNNNNTISSTSNNLKQATGGGGGNNNNNSSSSSSSSLIDNQNQNQNSQQQQQPTLVHRKVAVLGWKNVGKSSLVHAFVSGTCTVCPPPPSSTTTTVPKSRQQPTTSTVSTTTNSSSATTSHNIASSSSLIETTYTKTIRFRKVHFHTDIVDTTCGMMSTMMTDHEYYCEQHSPFAQSGYCSTLFRLSRNASLGVHGYILVFSLVNRSSFEQVQRVHTSLLQTLLGNNAPDTSNSLWAPPPRVLVGTMLDLCAEDPTTTTTTTTTIGTNTSSSSSSSSSSSLQQRQVSSSEAQALATSWKSGGHGVPYIECSSQTGQGVAEVFYTLLKEIEKDDNGGGGYNNMLLGGGGGGGGGGGSSADATYYDGSSSICVVL
jgi:GTPase SAR1 family protein